MNASSSPEANALQTFPDTSHEKLAAQEALIAELRDAQRMFVAAQRLAKVASWSIQRPSGALRWSDEAHRVLGFAECDFQHVSVERYLQCVPPQDRAAVEALLQKHYDGACTSSFRHRFIAPDGQQKWLCGEVESELGDDGRVRRVFGTVMDITAQEMLQSQVAHQESLLRMASRLGRIGGWVLELPRRAGYWSSELLTIYELEPQAPVSMAEITRLARPQWQATLHSALEACTERGVPVDLEFQSATAKGRLVWLHVVAEAVREADGGISRVKGVVQDVTDRRERDRRMRQLNDELVTTLESMSDAFYTLDADLRLTYANGAGERLLGVRGSEVMGRPLAELFPGYVGGPFEREYRRALAEGSTGRVDGYFQPLDKWLAVSVYPSSQGLALFVRDVSEGKRAHQALVESEERYRLLFETSADAIFSSSPDGPILRANRAARTMFRRSAQELGTLSRYQLVAPGEPRLQAMRQERLATGAAHGELKMLRGDGSVFDAEVDVSCHRGAEGAAYVNVVVRDATDRIRMRNRLLHLNDELAARVRERTAELERANDELKSYARSLAHDLRQPLASAKAFSFALEAALDASDLATARKYAGQLGAATRSMGGYVEALLSLVRVSQAPLAFEEVDLSAMASSLLLEFGVQEPSRRVAPSVEPDLYAVADPALIRMLLQNLLANAWKFTARRAVGHIAFGASVQPDGERVYSVSDDGVGFDSASAGRLFGQFQRFHRHADFPGMGIGLANAHRIVARHGGRIWAESRPGEGATFSFTLGRLKPSAE